MKSKLRGKMFGRLKVLRAAGVNKHRSTLWKVKCVCGSTRTLPASDLLSGNTRSCGCLYLELLRGQKGRTARTFKHGYAKTPTYISWLHMVSRCTNSRRKDWKFYGGAGVMVCKRWLNFENFLADLGPRPLGTSLGRFGDVGNYKPGNCAWQTKIEQGAERHKKVEARKAA
jgi:hypothetical protein